MPLCAGCKLSRFRQRHTTGVPPDLSKRDMHQPWELNPTASVSRCQRQWLDSMCSVASSMDGWNVLSHASQDNKPPLTAGMEACIRARRSVRRENVQAATALTGVEHKYLSRQYDKRRPQLNLAPFPLLLAHGTLGVLTGNLHAALPMRLLGTILASTPGPAPSAICRSTTITLRAEVIVCRVKCWESNMRRRIAATSRRHNSE